MSERVKIILDKNADILRLPAIALRGLVVFPENIIHFEVGRKKSIAAIEWAMSNNNAVFLTWRTPALRICMRTALWPR